MLAEFATAFWGSAHGGDEVDDSHFVNGYATTAVHEDLAETFTAWVLGWPVDDAVVDAKVAMLAADPGLAELAGALRARIPS